MFDELKQSLREAMGRVSSPEDSRAIVALMRDAIVEAKISAASMRDGISETRKRLDLERRTLETVRRRGQLAAGINDAETARIAVEYETRHAERVTVLERKLVAQEEELALAEREIGGMTQQLKAAGAGVPPAGRSPRVSEVEDEGASQLKRDMDRAARTAQAEDQLAELKRRMKK
ncbi:MAG: hypothetical protein H7Z74_04915 [Anaerolineae bacterium]|nr:hypothetical protein [Gemmatimonadaceae bacterium]